MGFTSYFGKIDGWITDYELRFLYCNAIMNKTIAEGGILEVGCWQGLSTSALAQADPVTVIDTFEGSLDEPVMRDILKDKPKDWIYDRFISNMTAAGLLGMIDVRRGTSGRVLPELISGGRKFRLIFVDGSHQYGDVKNDFEMSK